MEPLHGIRSRRYRMFLLIMLLALLNYVERGAISYAGSKIIGEYGFDRAQWGKLLGYFGYGYLLGALFGGIMSDWFGPKRVWLASGGAWSLLAIATAYGGDLGVAVFGGAALTGFAVVRVLFGFAEGPAYSLINKSNSNWSTPKERGFVVSMGLVSTPLGSLLTAPIAVGLLSLTGSWRAMFIVIGTVSLAALLYFSRRFTDKPEQGTFLTHEESAYIKAEREAANAQSDASNPTSRPPWWSFFQNPSLVLNAVGYFAMNYVTFLLLTWMPKYLQDEFHYSLSSLWYVAMIPWIGPCITVLLGGRLSDWLLRRTGSHRIARSYLAATCLLITTLCFLLISKTHAVWQILLLIALANAFNAMANCVYWAVVIDSSPSSRTGTFSGITHSIANLAAIIAPTLTGVLTQQHGYDAMFIAAAVATAVGMTAMVLVKPGLRFRRSTGRLKNTPSADIERG